MNYGNSTMEQYMSNMTLKSNLSLLIDAENYIELCLVLIKDNPKYLNSNIKKILIKFGTKDKIAKFVSAILSVLNSDTSLWKFDNNIILLFNELELESVSSLSIGCDRIVAQRIYDAIIEKQFEILFDNFLKYFEKLLHSNEFESSFSRVRDSIVKLTKLVEIKGSDVVLYPMTRFTELLLTKFLYVEILQQLSLDVVAHINHRLVNYLAVTPGHPVSKGLREAINIYSTVRSGVVNGVFLQPEIIGKSLDILEYRSRFFGLNADAIPENENHGEYIVIDPLNAPFEDDDVYDDYEQFLATLPN